MLARAIILPDTYRQMGIERSVFNGQQALPGLESIGHMRLSQNGVHPEAEEAKQKEAFDEFCERVARGLTENETILCNYSRNLLMIALEKGYDPMMVIDQAALLAQKNLAEAQRALDRLGEIGLDIALETGALSEEPQLQLQPEADR